MAGERSGEKSGGRLPWGFARPGGRLVGVLLLGIVACSDDRPLTVSADPRQNVMVIDEGFDVSAGELGGKVLASFTIECPDEGGVSADAGADSPDGGAALTFEERKSAYLAALTTPPASCHLVPGISAKSDPLASVRVYRDRWNGMLRGQRYGSTTFTEQEWNEITAAFDVEFMTFAYHGTATAGTVAHDNPGLRLVLVERTLAAPGSVMTSFQCLVQADIDQWVAVLTDPDVRQAYVSRPVSAYTEEFRGVIATYNVGVINESYGRSPRAVLEQLQSTQSCPSPISLGPYFAAWNELGRAWTEANDAAPPYVVTQSAGNDGAEIDSGSDSYECSPGSDRRLLVGSTSLARTRSTFSNFGGCVDLFAPGEHIIAPYAGGWLLPVQGTSFAAPLVAWMISRTALSPYDAVAARQRALDARDEALAIPVARFPRDFFYVPGQPGPISSALAAGETSTRVMPGRRADLDRVDLTARSLGPLGGLLRRRTAP